jgi:hypothetical protein
MAAKKAPAKKAAPKKAAKKAAIKPAPKKAASKKAPAKKSSKKAAKKAAARPGPAPRADKGDGEAAVQTRIAALQEPSRSILAKLHALVRKHAPGLTPTVRWGFAVYMREGKMMVVASPFTKYARLGFTRDANVDASGEYFIEYTDASQVDEAKVVALLKKMR